ncbi:head-to-tail adaptor [Microbacterium phage Honeyfin]|uniref:Head-to-tail adaptor n=1 Tax=Microbacterium phage Honeyfin TaxID=2871520 RepID=A0AAE7XDK1_9CAUD|nr:head-to-tail adaptor [Microbacterium phage Honeyfin]QZD98967.1 head-to-tail adaptor [Microbacterium phage Honeyfin]
MAEPMLTDDAAATPAAAFVVPTTAPPTQACGWPVVYLDCTDGDCATYDQFPADQREAARAWFEAQAIDILWNATKGVFGVCDVEVRPCRQDCSDSAAWGTTFFGRGPSIDPGFPRVGGMRGGSGFYPVLVSGQWFNITCGCLGQCSCSPNGPGTISLPGPVISITEVTIDGIVVPPSAYRLDKSRWLIRTDGGEWPGCQDMNLAPDAIGTFVVRYERGIAVPAGGQIAAGRLACELAMAACDDQNCSLPDNWQSITRQGLTVNADPNMDGTQVTGIWSIDEWIKQVNRPKSFASVRSVDLPNLR